ncbi:MAG TPA: exopolyphosphatase [Burkholderiales bacterium]|nr:exopolyphosphatase [Burkholderiales bacterium]
MPEYSTLAAVDLGSNSFRLQVARVVGSQLYELDSMREPVRLAAGLGPDKRLDDESQARALECLKRFGERLRGLPPHAVRAVGTNSLRVAKNAPQFLRRAQAALGFPIEVIAGREEARLIYVGVAHELPASDEKRLVMDIGGGSTEFIVGTRLKPLQMESLYMGCVSYSLRYFPGGRISKGNLKQAELAARAELQTIASGFSRGDWEHAFGSSGTVRAIGDILEFSTPSSGGITWDGLRELRDLLLRAGDTGQLDIPGMRADRAPILPGGFAILYAAFAELDIQHMTPANGALRQGVLYDLLGRYHRKDMREATVAEFMHRYHVDQSQARRVEALAVALARQLVTGDEADVEDALRLVSWAARLHEIGISVAHNSFHKHSAYILQYADMPGFSKPEQARLALLALAQRGSLKKMQGMFPNPKDLELAMALRLAALFSRPRRDLKLPALELTERGSRFELRIDADWLERNPLTEEVLAAEVKEWKALDVDFRIARSAGRTRAAAS